MKKSGQLRASVLDLENLKLAFWKAARGKADREAVQVYRSRLDFELQRLGAGLADQSFPVGKASRFVIHDPKRRIIHAAAFPERVLHHALMNVCEPVFERWLIHDTYACRKGKGQWAAVRRAEAFAHRYAWYLKADIRKYFDSVPHQRVIAMLRHRIKDPWVLHWFEKILKAHEWGGDVGLPIGSLTSQHLANLYLDSMDRWVKEGMKVPGYVRYMDDFVLWDDSPERLKAIRDQLSIWLFEQLGLQPKGEPYLNRTVHGMNFLGCRVYPGYSTLNRTSRSRFRRKLFAIERRWKLGAISEQEAQRRATSLCAFTLQVRSWKFRAKVLGDIDVDALAIGRQPRKPRRRLEQQRAELPLGEPQQEQPGQSEQQSGLPCRPSSNLEATS